MSAGQDHSPSPQNSLNKFPNLSFVNYFYTDKSGRLAFHTSYSLIIIRSSKLLLHWKFYISSRRSFNEGGSIFDIHKFISGVIFFIYLTSRGIYLAPTPAVGVAIRRIALVARATWDFISFSSGRHDRFLLLNSQFYILHSIFTCLSWGLFRLR